ncbi:branched-chain amino acid transport system II carrier protein [Clostridium sporogenes]|uniref:Branched-chain amino acid transport system carrier protein n=1 Tax=Clostridium botulinum TaxID=1491 RepID=A0A6M0SZQ1_CLOBO|nr:branched-chain amino acid transport system II carrier protein [Clostridium sporogenes]NFA60977.1 branched-chain amino acid transport system II carrier protein [Clostridium botulinum]NFI73572.1 branched-chain amino acid transport system II carrier protein [Clostridium sporogenes]NFL73528.1 branched-chain amino acid transport system II carrier protein [Clostridium sporogenes]NFM25826.1 branched-chain amino acid transport system II carrier protein [Clostridium sporogenes]NFP61180.1 branched-ch
MKKTSSKDFIVIGFALFAMFFGAGNLIFPPYMGKLVGDQAPIAIIGFLITGVGLPLSGIIACAKINGTFSDISGRVGRKFSVIATTALILAIGPMLAIPRTAATTYELGINPVFPSIPPIVGVAIYFAICLAFVLRPSGIVDNIGKILTPALLVLLAIIIIKGLVSPLGPVINTNFEGAFSKSLLEGYQTMDAMASVIFSSIILTSVRAKGYTDKNDIISATIKSGVVAILGLAFVYGGLMILGSQTSQIIPQEMGRSALVVEIVKRDLGNAGTIILGLAVGLACLTTAIGLISTGADYFSGLTKGKVSYNTFAIIISVVSALLGTGGVEKIVKFAVPVLQILYPIVIVLIVITLLGKLVKNNNIVKITVYTTLIVSVIDTINILTNGSVSFIKSLLGIIPLSNVGFSWLIPAIIAFIIGTVIFGKKQDGNSEIADA